MFGIGFPELLLILVVALLVVGPSRLPQVARSIGKALGDFRRMADDVKETIENELIQEDEKADEPEALGGEPPDNKDAVHEHEPLPPHETDAPAQHEPLPPQEPEAAAHEQDPHARKGS